MTIHELLNQFDMGDANQDEQERRVAMSLDALAKGSKVKGWIGKAIVEIEPFNGDYFVTQRLIILASEAEEDKVAG